MNPLPPSPSPDPRVRDLVLDFAAMDALVAELVVPGDASMYVMSALETARELIRHSYFRYEFATVAVTHSLFALEHVLAERAGQAGLIPAELAAGLDRARGLRDKLAQGTVTSAALGPMPAAALVRAVFDAVALLHRPAPVPEAADVTRDQLARLWEEFRRAPYPDGFRGVAIEGVELILLDADVAGLVMRELAGGLDDSGVALLWARIADLDKVVPLIDSAYCACYFAKLRAVAGLAAARSLPPAT
ncbi:hypothetical protein [Kitasatospora viridis]|uniref:Uncharacterized protein n=1 Tax=Kitasatospora viridis TaxID=281105 RepID=A0A561SEF9_9ACTN|nr:hypothetical protein [Kitasatospora viridis]TWF73228.1 hypothetical protein FHX73_16379 [Kitasatospora viridis]